MMCCVRESNDDNTAYGLGYSTNGGEVDRLGSCRVSGAPAGPVVGAVGGATRKEVVHSGGRGVSGENAATAVPFPALLLSMTALRPRVKCSIAT